MVQTTRCCNGVRAMPMTCHCVRVCVAVAVCLGVPTSALATFSQACCYNPACKVWLANHSIIPHCYHGLADARCTRATLPAEPGASEPPITAQQGGYRSAGQAVPTSYPEAEHAHAPDATWPLVNAPHDSVIGLLGSAKPPGYANTTTNAAALHGFLNRTVAWYRKRFHLAPAWRGSAIHVEFGGVYHYAQVWVNGVFLAASPSGYDGFSVRLDNSSALVYGNAAANVLAVRADASFGSGHWYEGGGIFRPVVLSIRPLIHFATDSVYCDPAQPLGLPCPGRGAQGCLRVTFAVDNDGAVARSAAASFQLRARDGTVVAATASPCAVETVPPGSTRRGVAFLRLEAGVALPSWSAAKPIALVLTASVRGTGGGGSDGGADTLGASVGFRSVTWAPGGMYLNEQRQQLRGFSNHNSFAATGVAMSPRLNLFRAQVHCPANASAPGTAPHRTAAVSHRRSLWPGRLGKCTPSACLRKCVCARVVGLRVSLQPCVCTRVTLPLLRFVGSLPMRGAELAAQFLGAAGVDSGLALLRPFACARSPAPGGESHGRERVANEPQPVRLALLRHAGQRWANGVGRDPRL